MVDESRTFSLIMQFDNLLTANAMSETWISYIPNNSGGFRWGRNRRVPALKFDRQVFFLSDFL